ncbi:hypothetical protein MXB_4420 [Myxobolus squamalis]|nr:hypothetical protein MXB_4420 [Myxobolus squamalis]
MHTKTRQNSSGIPPGKEVLRYCKAKPPRKVATPIPIPPNILNLAKSHNTPSLAKVATDL